MNVKAHCEKELIVNHTIPSRFIAAALDAIKQGNIYGTSYSDPYYESFVQTCMMLYCIQTGINSNVLGYEYTPFIELGTTIVTADNIDEIIASTHWDLSQYGY